MGSEFSFEDLSSFEIEKYTYQYLGDELVDGMDSFKVAQFPTDENSGYTKRIVWVDKQEYRIIKVEFYDRKKSLLKTLSYNDFKLYLDKYWRPMKMDMINHQTKKSTELNTLTLEFNTGLKDSDFNKATLKRAR